MPENTPQTYRPPSEYECFAYNADGGRIFKQWRIKMHLAGARKPVTVATIAGDDVLNGDGQHDISKLIENAVSSYARHCGPNAIQCAEDDLLGQALTGLRTCLERLEINNCQGEEAPFIAEIKGILSRLSTEQGVES